MARDSDPKNRCATNPVKSVRHSQCVRAVSAKGDALALLVSLVWESAVSAVRWCAYTFLGPVWGLPSWSEESHQWRHRCHVIQSVNHGGFDGLGKVSVSSHSMKSVNISSFLWVALNPPVLSTIAQVNTLFDSHEQKRRRSLALAPTQPLWGCLLWSSVLPAHIVEPFCHLSHFSKTDFHHSCSAFLLPSLRLELSEELVCHVGSNLRGCPQVHCVWISSKEVLAMVSEIRDLWIVRLWCTSLSSMLVVLFHQLLHCMLTNHLSLWTDAHRRKQILIVVKFVPGLQVARWPKGSFDDPTPRQWKQRLWSLLQQWWRGCFGCWGCHRWRCPTRFENIIQSVHVPRVPSKDGLKLFTRQRVVGKSHGWVDEVVNDLIDNLLVTQCFSNANITVALWSDQFWTCAVRTCAKNFFLHARGHMDQFLLFQLFGAVNNNLSHKLSNIQASMSVSMLVISSLLANCVWPQMCHFQPGISASSVCVVQQHLLFASQSQCARVPWAKCWDCSLKKCFFFRLWQKWQWCDNTMEIVCTEVIVAHPGELLLLLPQLTLGWTEQDHFFFNCATVSVVITTDHCNLIIFHLAVVIWSFCHTQWWLSHQRPSNEETQPQVNSWKLLTEKIKQTSLHWLAMWSLTKILKVNWNNCWNNQMAQSLADSCHWKEQRPSHKSNDLKRQKVSDHVTNQKMECLETRESACFPVWQWDHWSKTHKGCWHWPLQRSAQWIQGFWHPTILKQLQNHNCKLDGRKGSQRQSKALISNLWTVSSVLHRHVSHVVSHGCPDSDSSPRNKIPTVDSQDTELLCDKEEIVKEKSAEFNNKKVSSMNAKNPPAPSPPQEQWAWMETNISFSQIHFSRTPQRETHHWTSCKFWWLWRNPSGQFWQQQFGVHVECTTQSNPDRSTWHQQLLQEGTWHCDCQGFSQKQGIQSLCKEQHWKMTCLLSLPCMERESVRWHWQMVAWLHQNREEWLAVSCAQC